MSTAKQRLLLALPPLFFVVGATVLACTDLDLRLQEPFFDRASGSWPGLLRQPWIFLNLYGELPSLFLGLGALFLLLLSIGRPPLHPKRRPAAFLLFGLLLGPGLLVNGVFKTFWERPRPDSVQPFGGPHAFNPFLHFDPASSGGSFPSGHASMGFYLMAVGLLLLSTGRRLLAFTVLGLGLVAGTVIGLSRVVSGKHFVSDVVFAALLIWCSTLLLYRLMRLDRTAPALPLPPRPDGIRFRIARALSPVLILAILGYGSTRWPLFEHAELPLAAPTLPPGAPLHFHLEVEGRVTIRSGDTLRLSSIADGHGLPNARLLTTVSGTGDTITVTNTREGHFSRLIPWTILVLPPGRDYVVNLGSRTTTINTRHFTPPSGLQIHGPSRDKP